MRLTTFCAGLLLGVSIIPRLVMAAQPPHNVVLFVADGLRGSMVDDSTAPNMAQLARQGVHLRNGHSLFPTFTTANASALATGHYLGDTGDFSNTIYAGFAVPSAADSVTPFIENDLILGDLDQHIGDYLDEPTILKLARDRGLRHRRHRQARPEPDLRSHRSQRHADDHRRRRDRLGEGRAAGTGRGRSA